MRRAIFLTFIIIVLSSLACTKTWLPDERSGLGKMGPIDFTRFGGITPARNIFERTIRLPMNPAAQSPRYFDLYYFVRMPSPSAARTVLFLSGGPGEFIPGPINFPSIADFLIDQGYNVAFYHARGAGFSQFPPSNKYDKFLKTSYVIEDIEAIRGDLADRGFLGTNGKWSAVIAYSFGTVVAQQYAESYNANLNRLILIGVQSRHSFQTSPGSLNQFTGQIRDINRATLTQIFSRSQFNNLSSTDKNNIIDWAFGTSTSNGIYQIAEDKFGSLAFVVKAYCELKAQNELASNNLDYSQQFFSALRLLRQVGWSPQSSVQVDFGKVIENEYFQRPSGNPECGPDLTGSSDRVFNVVNIYDGINVQFLDKWLANGRRGVHDALKSSGGEVHYVKGNINPYLGKLGISDNEAIEPWDPARHKHDVVTIILRGSADTVPAGGATEHIFLNALGGPRTLIIYPGVGHSYVLPSIPSTAPPSTLPNQTACGPTRPVRDCLIYSFLAMNPTDFRNSAVNQILPIMAGQGASVCYRDQNTPLTLTIAGTCP